MTALGDIATVLRDPDPADKSEVYRQLGLRLTYQPETQTVRATVDLSAHRGVMVRVRGATRTIASPPTIGKTLKARASPAALVTSSGSAEEVTKLKNRVKTRLSGSSSFGAEAAAVRPYLVTVGHR
ncbi:hypothetical protein ACFHW0_31150, partial [Micromonospora sp. LOL_025]